MLSTDEALLESWNRQCRILNNVAGLITPELAGAKSGEDEWPIGEHLAHTHNVRCWWLSQLAPEFMNGVNRIEGPMSLGEIVELLGQSQAAVRRAMEFLLENPEKGQYYEHPVFYLQHMIWHEGWHVGAIMRVLRDKGQAPSDEWEELNMWAQWRPAEEWE